MTEKYVEALKTYIEAWNNHDESALMSIFIEGGTYQDSATGVPLTKQAIGAYAKSLWGAFPDLSFELGGRSGITPDGTAFVEWVMHGTNKGPFNGLLPTGRKINDFLRHEEES